ncbi:hypothetical protein BH23CHL2_BH23CHL2_01980 [soil metagenome]
MTATRAQAGSGLQTIPNVADCRTTAGMIQLFADAEAAEDFVEY